MMSRAGSWSRFRNACIVFAVAAAALAVFGAVGLGSQITIRAASDGSFVVFSAVAAVACFGAAREATTGRRLPWWLLGVAATCYAAGNAIWFYYQVLAPEAQTFPGPADVFYVAVVPFALAAMLSLPVRPLSAAARVRAIVDGLIMGAALLFISWILLVGPLVAQLGEVTWIYLFVYLYYPLTDILIITIAVTLATRATGAQRLPMLLVGAAFVSIACADTGIGYLALHGREAAGSGLDLGWTIGYMLLALAALVPPSEDAAGEPSRRTLLPELLPYVPVVVVLVVRASNPDRFGDWVLALLLVTVAALLVLRQLLTLAENVRLTRGLERLVAQRTHDLEQLTMRHQSILDSAGEGIVGLDRSGRVTFANPAAGALLGRSPTELAGARFNEVTGATNEAGEPIATAGDPVAAALQDEGVRTVTNATYQRADGTGFAVELTVAPARGESGVAGGVLIFRDVTERRTIERMKDEFVSVVSHELRTPLTSLRGALGLLQGGLLEGTPPKVQRMVQIAVESTDRLIRLINDILDVERIAAGKVTLERRTVAAADVVDRAVAEMRGLAQQAQIQVQVEDITGSADADPDRIVQTLTNLLSNAIRFSPPGGAVRVGVAEQDQELLFSISDEGPGIPPDQLEAIFGRFAQVDASDTREKEGSGLGLAICRGLVEQHGGRIWAHSEPGQGATFYFTLPAADPAVAIEPSPEERSAMPTVLVCEDDPQARAVIGEMLRSHGYAVVGVASGEEAVARAAEVAPAAVLMDLALPGIDGWTAIAQLRADSRTGHVPVLIVSGSPPSTPPSTSPLDVAAWLSKPLDLTTLLTALREAISGDRSQPCVLVVEDDQSLAHVLTTLFAEHGVLAVPAHTARDALRLGRDLVPDLLLLDLLLPDSDGFSLVGWLRQDPRLCQVPVVVYTALDVDEHDKERLRLGPTEFLTKAKSNPEEVEQQVMKLLATVVAGAAS